MVRARKDIADAAQARLNQRGGHDSASRRFSGEEECLLHVFGVARPCADSGRLLSCIVEQQTHFLGVEGRSTTRGSSGAEGRSGPMRAAMGSGLVGRAAHGHSNARTDVIPKSHGAQEMRASDRKLLAR